MERNQLHLRLFCPDASVQATYSLFQVSGGWYAERRAEPGDIKVQIQSALTTMKEVLEDAGSSMANVLKVHMTVAEPNKNIALLNEGYRGFFPDPPPVRSYTGCGVDQMGRDGILVQVDALPM